MQNTESEKSKPVFRQNMIPSLKLTARTWKIGYPKKETIVF